MRYGWLGGLVYFLASGTAVADERLGTERIIAEVMMDSAASSARLDPNPPLTELMLGIESDASETESADQPDEQGWAVLPQIGFSPERGPNAGLKFVDRRFTRFDWTVDLAASYALEGQQSYSLGVVAPKLGSDRWLAVFEAEYSYDPTKDFFGLGNNEFGPETLSTHELDRRSARLTIGAIPWPRLTIALSAEIREFRVDRGELEDDTPATVETFPQLPGLRGGRTIPIAFSLVYNNRIDVTRPTRGWNFTIRIERIDEDLGSDFDFTRYTLDASYLLPVLTGSQVLGLRVGGEFIDGREAQVPFWDLASLGGADDLRGFFEDRFLGRSRVMINAEYRLKLLDFAFFDIWRVRIDGVGFGDLGRVFQAGDDFFEELGEERARVLDVIGRFRLSYGGGLRVALSRALVARIDVGFSEEESTLVYLTFGHTF